MTLNILSANTMSSNCQEWPCLYCILFYISDYFKHAENMESFVNVKVAPKPTAPLMRGCYLFVCFL